MNTPETAAMARRLHDLETRQELLRRDMDTVFQGIALLIDKVAALEGGPPPDADPPPGAGSDAPTKKRAALLRLRPSIKS